MILSDKELRAFTDAAIRESLAEIQAEFDRRFGSPSNEGPQLVPVKARYTCTGCIHLVTEDWDFYGENDDHDSGVDASCAVMPNPERGGRPKHIDSYWRQQQTSPDWCPKAQEPKP